MSQDREEDSWKSESGEDNESEYSKERSGHKKARERKKKKKSTRKKKTGGGSKSKESGCSKNDEDEAVTQKTSENFSDEVDSAASDINPMPFRRRSSRSGSSVISRKARSEPILITLDSDSSEDSESDEKSRRRSKAARVKGRKVGKINRPRVYQSSSSDYEKDLKKAKKGLSPRKKFMLKHLNEKLKSSRHGPSALNKIGKLKVKQLKDRLKKQHKRKDAKKHSKKSKNSATSQTNAPKKKGRPRKYPERYPPYKKTKGTKDKFRTDSDHDGSSGEYSNLKIKSEDYKLEDNSDTPDSKKSDKNFPPVREARSVTKKKKTYSEEPLKRPRGRSFNEETDLLPNIKDISDYNPQTPFLQSSFCFDVASKISKCRECRIAVYKNSRRMYNSYCRFMEYRKLCHSKNGIISSAGFSRPDDATEEHLNQWIPQPSYPPKDLNQNTAQSLLEHIGDQFCDLVEQESDAHKLHMGSNQVTWKRIVQGVREMCDVCSTTIFNIHWVCPVCGFSVCIDCYKGRKTGIIPEEDEDQPKDRDEYKWLLCTQKQSHEQRSLILTQMIPGNALWLMKEYLHKAKLKLNLPSYCKCVNVIKIEAPDRGVSTGINKQLMSCVTPTFSFEKSLNLMNDQHRVKPSFSYEDFDVPILGSAKRWLDGKDFSDNLNGKFPDECYNSYEDFHFLRDVPLKGLEGESSVQFENEDSLFPLSEIIATVTNSCKELTGNEVKNYTHRYPQPRSGKDPQPIRVYSKIESDLPYSNVPHSWFCNGRLLFLLEAVHKDNLPLFQEQWKRGQPIMVKGVHDNLDMGLWHPDGFSRDFGEVKNDLVDCKTGAILKNLPMRKFWEGFEDFDKRLTDEKGDFLLLKLKDWPPGEDFSEKLPTRFNDLMKGLPLPEYTHRDGILNLAARLPPSFVRPDLGPKMYNAYGSALYPTKGTTNLHLDISDAVNVMVYVGIPSVDSAQIHVQEALKAIDEGGCDSLMRARVRGRSAKPGALWHIYNARDADKIRELLLKVAVERGEKLEANTDPIHDQSWYIDSELRKRLYKEYGVEGYAIAQCLGDAVFIPAGAPHQVRNLHSCVKVAEDFVSPENIAHCFKLTQEFRNLSDTHSNHEDKLQIKNIIYHVVRDALSHLLTEEDIKR